MFHLFEGFAGKKTEDLSVFLIAIAKERGFPRVFLGKTVVLSFGVDLFLWFLAFLVWFSYISMHLRHSRVASDTEVEMR